MQEGAVATPGAFNGLVARAVQQAGFDACYVSGGAITAASGVPDIGLRGVKHFVRIVAEVATGSQLPVVADADTGFGEAEMVARTVWEYAHAGAGALHIEDQVFPKRCGHLEGKQLVPVDHFQEKIAVAAATRDRLANEARLPGFVVCARTDAAGVEGFDAAIARASAYVEAGADMIFPEGLASEAEFGMFAEAMRPLPGDSQHGGPFLLANMTEFGKTPMISMSRFAALGYDVVIFPVTTLRIAMGAIARALATIAREGSAASALDAMQTRAELYDLLGYTPGEEWRHPGPAPRQSS